MRGAAAIIAMLVTLSLDAASASSPFELDLRELESVRKRGAPSPSSSVPKERQRPSPPPPAAGATGWVDYTVRPGDHLFRILMVNFGYSNAEAEGLIPLIREKNGISDIRRLSVGKTIRIPVKGRSVPSVTPADGKRQRQQTDRKVQERERAPVQESPATDGRSEERAPLPPREPAPPPGIPPGQQSSPLIGEKEKPSPSTIPADPSGPGGAPPPLSPQVPVGSLLAMAVTATEPSEIVLGIADALQLIVERNVIIETDEREGGFSIKVPMTLEGNGRTLVVTGATADPFQYTLYRLLASAGYGVIQLTGNESFREVARAVIEGLGLPVRYGTFLLSNGREAEADGFLIETLGGRILLTDRPVSGIWSAVERPPR